VRQTEIDTARRRGLTSEGREEIRKLRKENFELRRASEILKSASLSFGRELDPGRPK
jgi:transposase